MQQLVNRQILFLLVKAYNRSITDFYYFPDVILLDKQRLEKEDFELLLSGGYIHLYKHDSFGRYYKLSAKAEELLYTTVVLKTAKRKKIPIPARQAFLHFT
jgi:hypothetical protein